MFQYVSLLKYYIYSYVFCLIASANGARILCIFPVPFHSHTSVFRAITDELAKRGHDLVILTPLPVERERPNVKQIDVHEVADKAWKEAIAKVANTQTTMALSPVTFWNFIYSDMINMIDAELNCDEMQKVMRNQTEHFDLLVVEAAIRTAIIIGARFKAPIVQVSSFLGAVHNYDTIGSPVHPLLYSDYNRRKVNNLNLVMKIKELYNYVRLRYINWQMKKKDNDIIVKNFGKNASTIDEIEKQVQILLLNAHPIWDNNRPVPPSVLYLGALHMKKQKPLDKDLETFLNNSKHGVVYVSFGSKLQTSDMPKEALEIFIKIFSRMPYDILWKWNKDEFPNKPANVRTAKWLPQNDLLFHPKIKAFVTQAGLQSTDEAIAANVPLVAFPLLADQWHNAQMYERHGIGIELDLENFTEEEFEKSIRAVIEDLSYRKNIQRLSKIMEPHRADALEKAVYWIELAASGHTSHLKSPLLDVNFVEYYLIDVILFMCLIALGTLYFVYLLIRTVGKIVVNDGKNIKFD